jgi:DNA-binding response OmpR family regulator
MLANTRLLIVEDEFLIALDIQRAVEDANARHTVFARNWREVAALEDRLEEFDLAIVTPPAVGKTDEAAMARLVESGAAIVVCSAAHHSLEGTPLAGAETVDKPFRDEDLLAACARALERRSPR